HGELQEFGAAEDKFRLALEKAYTKPLRATVLTSRSTVRIRAGRWEDARRDLLEAIELQPKAYHGYVNLAQAYRLRGDLLDTLVEGASIAELLGSPFGQGPLVAAAARFPGSINLMEAVKALDHAIQLHPDATLYYTRARLQAKRGKPALARA